MSVGVAISTTGQPHRRGFLETAVEQWWSNLPIGSPIIVTVDGTYEDAEIVNRLVGHRADVYEVSAGSEGRLGVAASKNVGLEILDHHGVDGFFLSDDDVHPLTGNAPKSITDLGDKIGHAMVNWGGHRADGPNVTQTGRPVRYSRWKWPRGVVLYVPRRTLESVGGMVEEFGVGGHEHVEWSLRIHEAGHSPSPFPSPLLYLRHTNFGRSTGALLEWKAEDAPRHGETPVATAKRRLGLTTIRRTHDENVRVAEVLEKRRGSIEYVPYDSKSNGRTPFRFVKGPS